MERLCWSRLGLQGVSQAAIEGDTADGFLRVLYILRGLEKKKIFLLYEEKLTLT